jgi:hypothetical protein
MITWKAFGKKKSWPNFKVLCLNLPGVIEENHETLNQHSNSPGEYLNPRPPEYETVGLTTRPRRSVDLQFDITYVKLLFWSN